MSSLSRESYINTLAAPAIKTVISLLKTNSIHGILAIGGSCGTALATQIMRELPVGFPKLMVSTMASGNIAPYIGETDICMMYSVVDIAGRNHVLEMVLRNAAGGIWGMSRGWMEDSLKKSQLEKEDENLKEKAKIRIGITMFGVTTPAVTRAKERFEEVFGVDGVEVYIFHATGSGGRAMERLVSEGLLDAVLDLTTTEIADEVVGGVLSAGPERLSGARKGIPYVVSVGACDMVNFGTEESVPREFQGRCLHRHNPTVTLMRTTGEECGRIARLMARNILGDASGDGSASGRERIKIVFPVGGVSMLDVKGQSFWDPEADEVLFSTLEKELEGSGIEIIRDQREVNDPEFAVAVTDILCGLIENNDLK